MLKQIAFEEVTVLVIYNDYIELPRDLGAIGEKIQKLNITPKYKVSSPTAPFVISGVLPLLTIEFMEANEAEVNKYSLGIDQKTLRFTQKFNPPYSLSKEKIEALEKLLKEFVETFAEIWEAFNSIASRSIIERVGFITIFDIGRFPVFDILKVKPHYEFGSFRFFEVIKDNLEPFENTKIIPNAIIDPNIDAKTDELKAYKLVSDIATVPNSKGIVPPNSIKNALLKLSDLTIHNLKKSWEVLESV